MASLDVQYTLPQGRFGEGTQGLADNILLRGCHLLGLRGLIGGEARRLSGAGDVHVGVEALQQVLRQGPQIPVAGERGDLTLFLRGEPVPESCQPRGEARYCVRVGRAHRHTL
ncbi:MAG: hypothetical protein WKH64_10580 [Chloroflexia bacterium]